MRAFAVFCLVFLATPTAALTISELNCQTIMKLTDGDLDAVLSWMHVGQKSEDLDDLNLEYIRAVRDDVRHYCMRYPDRTLHQISTAHDIR